MMTEDESAIRKVVDAWMSASKAGDLSTVLSLMADDVIFMVPGREPFGKKEFAVDAQGMKDAQIEGTNNILEIQVFGNWAYLRNHIDMTATPSGRDAAVHQSGYTLTLMRKEQDGRWKLARDASLMTAGK
jgi:uncharacterized protein (TIGR02246 family)